MQISILNLLALVSAIVFIACLAKHELNRVGRYFKFWSDESERIQKPGQIGTKPGKREAKIVHAAFALPNAIENGRITVDGWQNLPGADSGDITMVLSMHLGHADSWLHSHLFGDRGGRFFIEDDMVPPREPAGVLLTMVGPILVDKSSELAKGKAGVSMKKALVQDWEKSGNAFADIFAQERIYPFDKPPCAEQLKPGLMQVAQGVAKATGRPVKIPIIAFQYHLDIRKANPLVVAFKRRANKALRPVFNGITPFWVSKYATTVVITEPFIVMPGEPSPSDPPRTLPRDKNAATKILGDALADAYKKAKAMKP